MKTSAFPAIILPRNGSYGWQEPLGSTAEVDGMCCRVLRDDREKLRPTRQVITLKFVREEKRNSRRTTITYNGNTFVMEVNGMIPSRRMKPFSFEALDLELRWIEWDA